MVVDVDVDDDDDDDDMEDGCTTNVVVVMGMIGIEVVVVDE